MREIKFRAWVKEVYEDGEFAYGGYMIESHRIKSLCVGDVTNFMKGPRGTGIEYFEPGMIFGSLERFRFDEIELMQYTGIKDSKGIEIYEGDIVEAYGSEKYTVVFDEQRGGYFPFATDDGCGCCSHEVAHPRNCEVIGNIFEHPHLLEE